MQVWRSRNATYAPDLTALIDAVGTATFGRSLLCAMARVAPIDFLSVYDLDQPAQPTMYLSASWQEDVSADCFRRYRGTLSARDRTFDGAMSLAEEERAALTHWHGSEFPADHRAAIYARHNIDERISLVSRAGTRFVAVNLYRYADSPRLSEQNVEDIELGARPILACVRKHLDFGVRQPAERAREQLGHLCPLLTPRELDTCIELLRGRTYDGIAAQMELSVATVKTYRARAFDKLAIHSKAELFAKLHRLSD